MRRVLPVFVLVAAALAACGGADDELPTATLALDFQPNAVHAGNYAAVREGLDERHGIDLRVRVPAASTDSLKLLAADRADVAVVDIHDLGLARERGSELVGVGALVQRPLAAVIAREGIERPRDLEGRRVGVTGLPSDEAVLRAAVEADGGDYARVRRVTIGFSAVPSLIAGKRRRRRLVLERRGRHAAPARPRDGRVPCGRLRRAALPRAGARHHDRHAARAPRRWSRTCSPRSRTARASRWPIATPLLASWQAHREPTRPLVRAQLAAVAPALRPPVTLDRERWRAGPASTRASGSSGAGPTSIGPSRRSRPDGGAGGRGQPSASRPATRAGASRAIRERGTTRVKPAASAARRTSCSTWA